MCLPPKNPTATAPSGADTEQPNLAAQVHLGGQAGAAWGRSVIDLTRTLIANFPTTVPGVEPATRRLETDYADHGYRGQRWSLYEHTGTHLDAPVHFIPGQIDVTQIPAADLVRPARVIDISARAAAKPTTVLTEDDLDRHEHAHGRIPDGAAVLLRSGWDRVNPRSPRYLNSIDGAFCTPGFSAGAVRWLLERRDVRCLGTDTSSIDAGDAADAPAHHLLLAAGRYAVEGLTGLHLLPLGDITLITAVIPWESGTGGPCRALALC